MNAPLPRAHRPAPGPPRRRPRPEARRSPVSAAPTSAARSTFVTGRATVGLPSRYRRRSASSAVAEAYRLAGSFSRHLRQMVSRSRGINALSRRGGTGSSLITWQHRVHRRGRLERRPTGGHAVQCRPQGINIGRRPNLASLPTRLLRRHVTRRPHDLTRAGQTAIAFQRLRQAEVGDPRIAVLIEQDVRRLQVTMNHPALVSVFDGLADTADQLGRLSDRQRPRARRCERLCPSTNPMEK